MTTSNSHHVLPLNFQLPLLPPDFGPSNAYPMSTASGPSGAEGSSDVAGRKQYYWNIVNSFLSFATILSYNFINANENFWSDSLCSLSFSYIVQHIEGFYCRKNIFYDFFSAVTLFNALSQPSLNLINLSLEHLNYPIYMYPDYLS